MSTILACTDGSQYSASIFQHAAWAASHMDAGVLALHVIDREETRKPADLTGNLGFDASSELMEELVKLDEEHSRVARLRGKAVLEDAARQLTESGVESVKTKQRHGSVVETLDEFEENAELLVIGKRGEHADFSKSHVGSNMERVVRSAKIPVLVASRSFRPVESFLLAYDGGPSIDKAIDFVAGQTLLKGAKAHLVSVGKPDSSLQSKLANAATKLRDAGFEVEANLLPGDPDEVIAAEVESRGIDLLVMGAYGHSRIRYLVVGSTTASLIRTCKIPVLLFR